MFLKMCRILPQKYVLEFHLMFFVQTLVLALQKHGELVKLGDKRVKTDRAAELIAVGVANQLPEIWICLTPVLYLMYLQQYAPSLCR